MTVRSLISHQASILTGRIFLKVFCLAGSTPSSFQMWLGSPEPWTVIHAETILVALSEVPCYRREHPA